MNVCIIGAQRDKNARYLYEEFKKKEFSKVLLVDLAKLYVEMSKVAKVYYRTELDWDAYIMRPRVEEFPFTFLVASILEEN